VFLGSPSFYFGRVYLSCCILFYSSFRASLGVRCFWVTGEKLNGFSAVGPLFFSFLLIFGTFFVVSPLLRLVDL